MRRLIDPHKLADLLIQYREDHKIEGRRMPQEYLAALIGIPRGTLTRWEKPDSSYASNISPIMFMRLKQLKIVKA